MSDATLPAPRSSSLAPATTDGNRSDSSSGGTDPDTSLIQSTDVALQEEGSEGRADNKQRRKRTSPKDQAILEAEYTHNPKPNKAARAVIVEKVDMNEKEVQIWFQNRRQIHRRKSRPLLPHEIAAFGLGGIAALSSDPVTSTVLSNSQNIGEPVMKAEQEEIFSSQEEDRPSSQRLPELEEEVAERVDVAKDGPVESTADITEDSQTSQLTSIPTLKSHSSSEMSSIPASSFSSTESVFKSFSSTPGYLSNRWNTINSLFSTPLSSQTAPFITPSISHPILPSSCPEKIGGSDSSTPSSKVMLSMSLDGKAQLVTADSSPPRESSVRPSSSGAALPQKRMRGLQRSQSAALPPASLTYFHRSPLANGPFIPRLSNGRSRDARTWEFCCDPEARDELTTQAENESNGSAVAAISLMRSTSKTALKPNSNKRNAPSARQDTNTHGKKLKLGRAISSLARLQSTGKPPPGALGPRKDKDGFERSPSGDSDKENWIPNDNGGNPRRRPLPSGATRQSHSKAIFGDNFNVPTHAYDLGGSKNRRRKGAYVEPKVFEDKEKEDEVPAEVEKFMRGEISPSKKGDLDCVQGLLSLSQGNWR